MGSSEELIVKKTIYAGTKSVPFTNGTKVHFHFQTRTCNDEKTLIDDSKKMGKGKSLELVLGKKFKLEVWEVILQKMALNEVAQFTVDKRLVAQYPFVSKTIRDSSLPHDERKSHCCAMTLQTEGLGYDDLNDLFKNPCNLEFTIELLKVEQPEEYEKEHWQMSEDERIKLVPQLRDKGNALFKDKNYKEAADNYAQAIAVLEQMMLKEKPHDTEWLALNKQKIPLLLNFSQCKLSDHDYYPVIEHCSTVLQSEPDNVKALFRRAKAHVAVWNSNEAKQDFNRVMELDASLALVVEKELQKIDELLKTKDQEDKERFKNLFGK